MTVDRIFLTGFMGAGKTTIGKKLAKQRGYEFIDLDILIEQVEGMTIKQIFAKGGEELFRDIEHRELVKQFAHSHVVVATGGGTFVQERNHTLMVTHGLVVFIDTSLNLIRRRLEGDTTRPLLQNDDKAKQFKLFMTRQPLYRKAHVIVNGRRSISAIVNDILQLLEK